MTQAYQTERIREAADIVAVVGQYVRLKRVGKEHAGQCPFHRERTPSFQVNPARQAWICRAGCGGGDVFSFVQRIEGLSFLDARRKLADQCGIGLDETKPADMAAARRQRAYAQQIAAEASWFWGRIRSIMVRRENETMTIQRRAEMWLADRVAAPDSPGIEYAWCWMVRLGPLLIAHFRGYINQIDDMTPAQLVAAYSEIRTPELVARYQRLSAWDAAFERAFVYGEQGAGIQ